MLSSIEFPLGNRTTNPRLQKINGVVNSLRFDKPSIVLKMVLRVFAQLPEEPAEVLVWNLEDYQDETGATWVTATFPAIPDALYNLTSSSDLVTWETINSFYALGSELDVALFEKAPSPESEAEQSTDTETSEVDPVTIYSASLKLRPLAEGSGTLVIWPSLEPADEAQPSLVRRVIPNSLDST